MVAQDGREGVGGVSPINGQRTYRQMNAKLSCKAWLPNFPLASDVPERLVDALQAEQVPCWQTAGHLHQTFSWQIKKHFCRCCPAAAVLSKGHY